MSLLPDTRQYPLVAVADIDFSDIVTTAVAVNAVVLPQNSVVTKIDLVVDTAFAGGTTHDLDIGDDVDPNRYTQTISEIDAAGVPANPPAADFYQTTDAEPNITITPTHTGAALTSGAGRLIVEYVIAGRANENQG